MAGGSHIAEGRCLSGSQRPLDVNHHPPSPFLASSIPGLLSATPAPFTALTYRHAKSRGQLHIFFPPRPVDDEGCRRSTFRGTLGSPLSPPLFACSLGPLRPIVLAGGLMAESLFTPLCAMLNPRPLVDQQTQLTAERTRAIFSAAGRAPTLKEPPRDTSLRVGGGENCKQNTADENNMVDGNKQAAGNNMVEFNMATDPPRPALVLVPTPDSIFRYDPHSRESRSDPAGDRTRSALVVGEQSNRSAVAPNSFDCLGAVNLLLHKLVKYLPGYRCPISLPSDAGSSSDGDVIVRAPTISRIELAARLAGQPYMHSRHYLRGSHLASWPAQPIGNEALIGERRCNMLLACALGFRRINGSVTFVFASMEQRRFARAGGTVDPRENQPTCGIVRHDSQLPRSGSASPGYNLVFFCLPRARLVHLPPLHRSSLPHITTPPRRHHRYRSRRDVNKEARFLHMLRPGRDGEEVGRAGRLVIKTRTCPRAHARVRAASTLRPDFRDQEAVEERERTEEIETDILSHTVLPTLCINHHIMIPRAAVGLAPHVKPNRVLFSEGLTSGSWHVGAVADDTSGMRVFSGISRFPHTRIPALLDSTSFHPYSSQDFVFKRPRQLFMGTFKRGYCVALRASVAAPLDGSSGFSLAAWCKCVSRRWQHCNAPAIRTSFPGQREVWSWMGGKSDQLLTPPWTVNHCRRWAPLDAIRRSAEGAQYARLHAPAKPALKFFRQTSSNKFGRIRLGSYDVSGTRNGSAVLFMWAFSTCSDWLREALGTGLVFLIGYSMLWKTPGPALQWPISVRRLGVHVPDSWLVEGVSASGLARWLLHEVNVEQCQNASAGETEDPRENPPTSGIVLHDSCLRKSGVTRPGIEPGLSWWEASSLTTTPPWPLARLKY
ncbi:hypothetical protein PR048_027939 [Dryococelus australis]|uniref:Uncharacterized protein n=1 Tax=Dryococelus australis TaxID=614101 RepID=A0ABQ9GHU5_9NEOP|nr:hypothetical protein PR048_027939 [Dryococelus australis]